MNKILISQTRPQPIETKTFYISLADVNSIVPILRADYFIKIQLVLDKQINNNQLKFIMQFSRILIKQGEIVVRGVKESVDKIKNILKNMGLYLLNESQQQIIYTKNKKQNKIKEQRKQKKLSIGFKSIEDEQIDEDELLKNEKIDLNKQQNKGCSDKIRACSNCTCGRKKQQILPSKIELVNSVNQGKLISGCGKCFLGDSFRCATCPYKGLPAFKPGDQLKIDEKSEIVVENNPTVINDGKVKIQI